MKRLLLLEAILYVSYIAGCIRFMTDKDIPNKAKWGLWVIIIIGAAYIFVGLYNSGSLIID